MVIALVYGYIDKQTDGIDRHGDREIWRWREAIHPDAYLSGLVGFSVGWFGSVRLVCRVTLVWVGLIGLGWFRFFALHKKIF